MLAFCESILQSDSLVAYCFPEGHQLCKKLFAEVIKTLSLPRFERPSAVCRLPSLHHIRKDLLHPSEVVEPAKEKGHDDQR